MTIITEADLEDAMCYNNRIANMGYVNDPGGRLDGQQKGYAYWYRFVKYPRLELEYRTFCLDDGGTERHWHVDGSRCPDLPSALAMLSQPPLMSLLEAFAFSRLPPDPFPFWLACQWIGGIVPESPNFIDSEGRYRLAYDGMTGLQNKNLVEYIPDEEQGSEDRLMRRTKP